MPDATCAAMEKATMWRAKVVKSIGAMLADLPNARELYKDHVWPDEEEEQAACWEAEEEDVFGHRAVGLDDNPEAYQQQGLFDKADTMPGKLEEQAGLSVNGGAT